MILRKAVEDCKCTRGHKHYKYMKYERKKNENFLETFWEKQFEIGRKQQNRDACTSWHDVISDVEDF